MPKESFSSPENHYPLGKLPTRLAWRALHELIASGETSEELLKIHGINDSTILEKLEEAGLDITHETRQLIQREMGHPLESEDTEKTTEKFLNQTRREENPLLGIIREKIKEIINQDF